jgi:hypothetical protein
VTGVIAPRQRANASRTWCRTARAAGRRATQNVAGTTASSPCACAKVRRRKTVSHAGPALGPATCARESMVCGASACCGLARSASPAGHRAAPLAAARRPATVSASGAAACVPRTPRCAQPVAPARTCRPMKRTVATAGLAATRTRSAVVAGARAQAQPAPVALAAAARVAAVPAAVLARRVTPECPAAAKAGDEDRQPSSSTCSERNADVAPARAPFARDHSTKGKRTFMLGAAKRGKDAVRSARAMQEPCGVPANAPSMLL